MPNTVTTAPASTNDSKTDNVIKSETEPIVDEPKKTENSNSLKMSDFRFENEKIKKPKSSGTGLRKELSGGQFLGSLIGLLIIGLIFFGGLYYMVNKDYLFKGPKYHDPVTTPPISLYLEVGAPENGVVVLSNTVVVSGKTIPDAVVAILSPGHNEILSANVLGEFSKVFPLDAGLNPIQITVFDNKGNSKSEIVEVYYSNEPIEKEDTK